MVIESNDQPMVKGELRFEIRPIELMLQGFCICCGSLYMRLGAVVVMRDDETDFGMVCPECVAAGPEGAGVRCSAFAERIFHDALRHSIRLNALARWLVGERKLPTIEQLQATQEQNGVVMVGGVQRTIPQDDLAQNAIPFVAAPRGIPSPPPMACTGCAHWRSIQREDGTFDGQYFWCEDKNASFPFVGVGRADVCDAWQRDGKI